MYRTFLLRGTGEDGKREETFINNTIPEVIIHMAYPKIQ